MHRSLGLAIVVAFLGCEEPGGGSGPGETETPVITVEGPTGPMECALLGANVCDPVTDDGEWCDGGQADLIVIDGEVVEVVCYPEEGEQTTVVVDASTTGDVEVGPEGSNTVIVFDGELEVFHGDIIIDANNVTLAGNGPSKTIIDGSVFVRGNNVTIRGVTITGNLSVGLNTAVVLLTKIHGDVEVTKNNILFVDNQVWGSMSVLANNASIIGSGVAGDWRVLGNNAGCDGNYGFDDADGDHVVAEAERAGVLACD